MLENQSRHVDAFIAPSAFCAGKHREFGFRPQMQVLPNFLPDNAEAAAESTMDSPSPPVPYFLFVGRLEYIKGLQDVIPLIDDDGPAQLWIAGTGNYEPELRELAAGRSAVRFLGQQTAQQLRRLYRGARAVITPSICYEVFPMVVLEAFREGTPIIARDLGPYPEIVAQSDGGLTFRNPTELKSAMSQLAADDQLRNKLGNAGRRAFENNWSESVVLDRYFELIGQIARQRKAQFTNVDTAGTDS